VSLAIRDFFIGKGTQKTNKTKNSKTAKQTKKHRPATARV
jgi:hypothetical protein